VPRPDPEKLERIAARHRETLVRVTFETRGAYLAQALGCIDLMTALLHGFVRCRPDEPRWPGRDRFLLSPGHYALPLYACLAERSYFDPALLSTFKDDGSPVELAAHRGTLPGVEASGGSLGQIASVGVGMALAARLQRRDHRVFVMMSDGEQAAGQVWEAAAAAAHHRLGRLVAVVDCNGFQVDGPTREVMDMEPLADKYRAFGWVVAECDGHDMAAVVNAVSRLLDERSDRPRVLLGRTVRGKGLPFMEADADFHYTRLDDDMHERARRILGSGVDDA
jgi:transketolase